ncbi:hypothetical protein [Meiothermus taiwanensis]|uniref:Uncharacterized protein n=1 Tax=Meiothermus taiwanensis WR-220 TaxID=1339250 RepID=A0ABM6WH10_9DEIN|nr:hypothetical protein [Meiothermus taiwanensis]AWR86257.1 hypothetical protein Mtai_v1c10130 [Meiothermus taiwanensis WR-220]
MSYLTANGIPVSSGVVTIPRIGRPLAELRLGEEVPLAPGEAVILRFEDGTTYRTTARRGGPSAGITEVFLVGGYDGLSKILPPKDYEGVPASLVVRDLLTEAGEQPGELDLPTVFVRWARRGGTAAEALKAVMARLPDRAWRVLPDGTTWAGAEPWPQGPEGAVVSEAAPQRGWFSLLPTPALRPGVVLKGLWDGQVRELGRVERVIHQIGAKLRTAIYIG